MSDKKLVGDGTIRCRSRKSCDRGLDGIRGAFVRTTNSFLQPGVVVKLEEDRDPPGYKIGAWVMVEADEWVSDVEEAVNSVLGPFNFTEVERDLVYGMVNDLSKILSEGRDDHASLCRKLGLTRMIGAYVSAALQVLVKQFDLQCPDDRRADFVRVPEPAAPAAAPSERTEKDTIDGMIDSLMAGEMLTVTSDQLEELMRRYTQRLGE